MNERDPHETIIVHGFRRLVWIDLRATVVFPCGQDTPHEIAGTSENVNCMGCIAAGPEEPR